MENNNGNVEYTNKMFRNNIIGLALKKKARNNANRQARNNANRQALANQQNLPFFGNENGKEVSSVEQTGNEEGNESSFGFGGSKSKKSRVKKSVAKKTPVKKSVAKKTPVKKSVAKRKTPVKKSVAKRKTPVKKSMFNK